MTRINVVDPSTLTDQHLLAEYRELPRVFPLARAALARGIQDAGPPSYTLGVGHVRFFYPRTTYLTERQARIIREMVDRGFAVRFQDPPAPLPSVPWEPSETDGTLNRARLRVRLLAAPRPGYYTHRGRPVPPDFYGAA